MKRLIGLLASLLIAVAAFAQTPEEIISRMEQVMEEHEKEGMIMTMDIKIPILGTMSTKSWMLGEKFKTEGGMKGKKLLAWFDETTSWTYDVDKNEITIEDRNSSTDKSASDTGSNAEMFNGAADGYDVSLKKETADAWYILCKKSKTNMEKDDPKTMDLVVAKGTYYPVSISAKMSGVKVTLRDVAFGVTEKQVTFNPADYPTATVVDKRGGQPSSAL